MRFKREIEDETDIPATYKTVASVGQIIFDK